MDSSDDDPFNPSSLSSKEDEKLDNNVGDLLEQSWFFGQVLSKKPAGVMPRCYSDPSPNFDQRLLADNSSSKNSDGPPNLIRTPSLPPWIGRPQEIVQDKDQKIRSSKISKPDRQLSDLSLVQKSNKEQTACVPNKESMFPRQKMMTPKSLTKHKLLRTPSLPSPREHVVVDHEDDDSNISMGRLIREAISNSPEILPPRSKCMQGVSMQKNKSTRSLWELGYQNQKEFEKSLSDLEPQEVQGFKDLGFRFNQEHLNPSAVGLQHRKKPGEADEVKRAYCAKSCAPPPIPIWANKNSTQDIKLQLKHWARAVASNAR